MAFRVRKWPILPDPRLSSFTYKGWNFGAVPSWKWVMSAVGATGIYSFLNDGIILDQNGFTDGLALWQGETVQTVPTLCTFAKEGFETAIGDPLHSLILSVNIAPPPPITPTIGKIFVFFPPAVQRFNFIDVTIGGVPNEDLPGGVRVDPAIWNLETL